MTDRTIRLGAFYRSLPMMVAESRGIYESHGVEVEFGQVTSSTQQFDYLADGKYDVVQTSPDNTANYLLNEDNPIGRRVEGQGFLGLDYGMKLIVVASPDIERVEDLRGRIVSVDAPTSGFAYVIYEILGRHGLNAGEDYEVVSHGGVYDRFMAMVVEGEDIQATLMSGGFETRAEARGFRLLESVLDIADPYLGVWAAARRDWLSANRELVVDFVRAYLDATDWVFDEANRDECISLLAELPNTDADLAAKLYEIQTQPRVGNVPDGSIDRKAVKNVLALREQYSGFEEPQDLDALVEPGTHLFDLSILEEARSK